MPHVGSPGLAPIMHTQLGPPMTGTTIGGIPTQPFGALPITIPVGVCDLLTGDARTACLIARGLFPGDPAVDPCGVGFNRVNGACVPITPEAPAGDPTPIGTTPAEGASGLRSPSAVCVNTLVCPTFADGKKGILWMNALSGEVVCLPRGTNGKGFGLIRKNKPRRKPFISAAAFSQLAKIKAVQTKAKKFAGDAGFTCKKK